MSRASWWVALAAGGAALTMSSVASADGSRAEQLFQEARSLGERGKYAEACPLLEESQSLEPAIGTQFNLADCWEHVGRTASAYELFGRVADTARAAGRFEREKSARDRAARLEPKLAKLRIVVLAEAPGESVDVDDKPFAKASWAKATPVDPGPHRIAVSAPDRKPWQASVEAKEGTTADVSVPALVDTRPSVPNATNAPAERRSTQKTIALVVGGVGVAGLAVGAVTGVLALGAKSDGEDACPKDRFAFKCPTQDGADAWNRAETMGTISTIGFVAGAVLVAGAAALWLTAPRSSRVGVAARSLVLGGTF